MANNNVPVEGPSIGGSNTASGQNYNSALSDALAALMETKGGGGGGGKKTDYNALFNNYYNGIIDELKNTGAYDGVSYNPTEYTARTQQEIASQIAEYMMPELQKSIASQRTAEKANRTAVDIDAASRGMGSSTWATDSKNRISNATQANIAGLQSDYASTLAQNVASQYLSDMQTQLSNDQFNASNKLSADEFNAQIAQALLDTAYSRAGDSVTLWQNSQKKVGGSNNNGLNTGDLVAAYADANGGGASGLNAVTDAYKNGKITKAAYADYLSSF